VEPAPVVETAPEPVYAVPVVHDAALMVVMRGVETAIWPDPFARTQYFGAHYEEAFTRPPIFDTHKRAFEWDGDPWPVNVFGHALFGSELYMRARTCRVPWYGSIAFAAAGSTLWEYAFEANGVRPSGLDLVWTPLVGSALGEGRFAIWRAAAGFESKTARIVVRAVVDPLGEAERALGTGC
jgi:hypothetical protein